MSRKGQSITLSISERDKAQLEAIALECMTWAFALISQLVGRRQLLIALNNDWTESRIKALDKAVDALTDAGKIFEAKRSLVCSSNVANYHYRCEAK